MQPTEAWRVLTSEHGVMGFAMVFECPHGIPELRARSGHHAALAGGGENFVLAEAPGGHITKAPHGLAVDAGAVGLSAVLDHGDAVGAG